jgi:tRNA A37 threonylcarbamoyladenosine synthetase subunit TsaC/SUA5/YrdC
MNFFRQEVDSAVDELLAQHIILYPTDTVWGLGCDAEVPRAVEKLYKLKGRAEGTPSIVLVADLEKCPLSYKPPWLPKRAQLLISYLPAAPWRRAWWRPMARWACG